MAAYSAAVSLKRFYSYLINYYDALLPPPCLKVIELAHKELKSFQNFVERLDSSSRKRMNASLGRIPEALRKFEEDLFPDQWENHDDVGSDIIQKLEQEAQSLIETLKKMEEEYCSLLEDEEETVSSPRNVSKSMMVGLSYERSRLKEELVDHLVENTVSTVVGMSGIGKTTLAREIFEDLDISEWFDCRAWVTISNEWRSEITEAILAQVNPDADQRVGYEEERVKRLKECLKGKRYLIVLDDIWRADVYDYLVSSFPDNKNGSRVLITTRIQHKALDISFPTYLFEMRLLNKEESWHLLRDKVFAGDSCPPQLEDAGKTIAEKCDGLPLTIVTVADLLSKAEMIPESLWIDIAAQKKHQLFIDAYDQISEVLYPSYKELPDELKLCFLYMGVFPQNSKIPQSKIVNLWIAEDVVQLSLNPNLEYCPLKSLQFFYFSSLIIVYQTSISFFPSTVIEKIKICGLHSAWWHFCQREARKTNFFYVLDCYQDGLEEGIKSQSRLSIHNNVLFALKDVYNSMEEHCASTAHSLLCLGPYNQYMVPICYGLKLLQRLDALNIRFYDFPLEVLELVKLRYLALTCNGKLPPSISKLQKLQYLIVHLHLSIKSGRAPSYLPVEIWDMKKLKHLDVMGCNLPDLGDTSLLKLLTLSNYGTTSSCIVLKRVPNLKKLGIRIEMTPDAVETLSCFDHISQLTKLESLKCVVVNPGCKFEVVSPIASFPCLPYFLNKLSLSGLGYPWKEMSKIASLPNLEVLKLRYNAFRGPIWEAEENGFQKLYSLLIEDIDLVKLNGARGSFKCLKFLSIIHCYKLEELHLGHFQDVWKIKVIDCNPLVERNIKDTAIERHFLPDYFSVHSSWKS